MRNKIIFSKMMLMGIVIVLVITTTFPTNAQITKLFPVTEEVSLETTPRPIKDTFSSDPYSEKIVYPPPPGVTLSPTISSSTSALPTLAADLITNDSNLTKSPSLSADEKALSSNSNHWIKLSSSTEINSPQESIQFKQDDIPAGLPPLTTQKPFITKTTNIKTTTALPVASDEIKTIPSISVTETAAETITNHKPCTTPIGKNGGCKDLRQCPSLFKLLLREPLLVENKLYLQRSQCGFDDKIVLICCPDNVPEPTLSPKWSLLPKPGMCGKMNENRLYGGYITDIDSYSWMALLEYDKGGNETGFHCGGSLISDRYVLTAAHCVTDLPKTWSLKSVRLGEWDVTNNMDCSKYNAFPDCSDLHINVPIDEIISHKGYLPNSKNKLHDIALIRLAHRVNSTDFIQPICLPHGENNLHAFDEQGLDLVGWGASPEGLLYNIKERATVEVIQLDKCRSKYAENNITLEQSQFCVESRMKNDTCRIDSGGPVISFDTSNKGLGSYFIGGIQSFGASPCWLDELPGVYTRVGEYLDWILENIHE